MISTIVFFILAIIILGGGILAVTSSNIFRSAVYLLFSLFGVAGLYFFLEYDFIAAVQIVVYVGGIVVLIIFSVFLTHRSGSKLPLPSKSIITISSLSALLAFCFVYYLASIHPYPPSDNKAKLEVSVSLIGEQLLSIDSYGYVFPFEVVSMLLLAAMTGCIVIAIKKSSNE
jgi:NADH-quinone oxidoreductase subunit J